MSRRYTDRIWVRGLAWGVLAFSVGACGGRDLAQIALNSQSIKDPSIGLDCRVLTEKSSVMRRPAFQNSKIVLNGELGGWTKFSRAANSFERNLPKGHQLVAVLRRDCPNDEIGKFYEELRLRANVRGHDRGLSPEFSVAFELSENHSIDELKKMVEGEPCIAGISERTKAVRFGLPNDPRFIEQKHHAAIKSEIAWDTFFHADSGISKPVVIAIIDDGISLNHEDLKDQIWVNPTEIPANNKDDDKNGFIDDVSGYNFPDGLPTPEHRGTGGGARDHGSHVAGLSAAQINNSKGGAGIMGQNSKIMALNVFGLSNSAETEDIDAAIRYAADMGANVINLSLGGPGQSESTLSALQYAASKGVVIVAAAGNDNVSMDSTFFMPAGYAKDVSGMVAVASTDAVTGQRSFFSNYSKKYVEIAAPGSNGILSTVPTHQYRNEQGTSMASPIVAGSMALAYGLIWSRTGSKPPPDAIKNILMNTADQIPSLQNYVAGGNHLNLRKLAERINQDFPEGRTAGSEPGCP